MSLICPVRGEAFSAIDTKQQRKYCSHACRIKAHAFKKPYPGLNTATVGCLGELKVCTDLLARGLEVFKAVSPGSHCTLVIVAGARVWRVEVCFSGYERTNCKLYYPKKRKQNHADIWEVALPSKIRYFDAKTDQELEPERLMQQP